MNRTAVVLLGGMLVVPCLAHAQSPLLDRGPAPAVWFQVQRPSFADPGGSSGEPSAILVDAGGRMPIGAGSELVVAVPLVLVTGDVTSGYKRTMVGNPYLGLRSGAGATRFGMGVRVPVVPDDAAYGMAMGTGGVGDPDQIEAYLPSLVTATATIESRSAPSRAGMPTITARVGVTTFFPTEGGDVNAMGNYAFFVHAPVAALELGAGITGRIMLTNTGGADLGERTWHQLAVGAAPARGRVRPTLFVRIPLDDDLQELDYVVGVGVVMGPR